MKIQLSSTLPFSPVQLDSRRMSPRRAVGLLQGVDGDREYRTPVYEFRHGDDDQIHYQVDPQERVYSNDSSAAVSVAHVPDAATDSSLEWVEHHENMNYKPYAFEVMNAMTQLVSDWDGVIYQAPSGERLREAASDATLQVVDACVCQKRGLWVQVNLMAEAGATNSVAAVAARPLGWVPLRRAAA